MPSLRRTAVVAGLLFLVTHVTSVTALVLYHPVLDDARFVTGSGASSPVLLGALLEVVLALAIVGTSVAMYPLVRAVNEAGALAYVGLRTLEAAVIAVGVVPLLAVVTLRQDGAGDGAVPLAQAMVALHNWTFLVGPSFVCGTNTVVLAALLRRSARVPAFIPVLGLVGGPLVFASGVAQLFGVIDQISTWAALGAVPVFAWEICLALFLLLRGFRSSAEPERSAPYAIAA